MPAPSLTTLGDVLTIPVLPGRRYAYSVHCIGSFAGATVNVWQADDDSFQLLLAAHTEPGGNEIVTTTGNVRFTLDDDTPAEPIIIHLREITGK
jgi:hypothetical protein